MLTPAPLPRCPTLPASEDWYRAARDIQQPVPSPWGRTCIAGQILFLDGLDSMPREWPDPDPLGSLIARARDTMRTRYRNSPAYSAMLDRAEAERIAAAKATEAARACKALAAADKERQAKADYFAAGGDADGWETHQQEQAEAEESDQKAKATARRRRQGFNRKV